MNPSHLRIVHCFRSPVGGVFRHVRDLVDAQSAAGHSVGILCDSSTGGEHEERLFESIKPKLSLGISRIAMRRAITPGDVMTMWKVFREIKKLQPDILHSHSAKGGAYARVIGSMIRVSGNRVARLYCPHGGSIHYDGKTLKGRVFFSLERFLERLTDRLVFVSKYEMDGYFAKVGKPRCAASLIYNGLSQSEYKPVKANKNAAEFLYIGMMRDLKGPDVFLDALAVLQKPDGSGPSAHFVGDGPDKDRYVQQLAKLGLQSKVTVHGAMPARTAFAMAKCVVVPSRAESMPYIVLEAVAAARPVICTNVGGIPEIFEAENQFLVEPGNSQALARAMSEFMKDPGAQALATQCQKQLKTRFSVEVMAKAVMDAYHATLNQ